MEPTFLNCIFVFIFQVVGNRGTVEINPRLLMPKESSIVGVMLPKGEEGLVSEKYNRHGQYSKDVDQYFRLW